MKPGDQGEVNFPEDTIVITVRNTPENLLLAPLGNDNDSGTGKSR